MEGAFSSLPQKKKIMKKIIDKVFGIGRYAAIGAGAGYGASKIIEALLRVSQKDSKVITKFGGIFAGVTAVTAVTLVVINKYRKQSESKAYGKERDADAELYERQRRADAELYTVERMADENLVKTKAEAGAYRKPKSVSEDDNTESDYSDETVEDNDDVEGNKTSWIEKFKSMFAMPALPPFIDRIMLGVPTGYEEAMLLHLCSMLGAMCFSKVRAMYSDGIAHAANLQVVIEGNWGTGKAKFEQLFKVLFSRIINHSKNKIDIMSEPDYEGHYIVQTTGIGTSMSKYVDILAENQDCHMYIFNSEVRALFNDLKKTNGVNFDFLRKAFENGDVCRNNKAKDSKNGIFSIYLNYTLTGTPHDIYTTFKKELEGGTLSRIAWACIPEAGRYPGVLRLPEGNELEALKDQIEEWTETFCYRHDPEYGDEAVDEISIDLDYICKSLDDWNELQYEQSENENNPARKDVRMRMAAIAFHCAIVFHMLFGNPNSSNWQKRKQVVDLTLFVANYCIERFLHKFGKEQNLQRKANQDAEWVDAASANTAETPKNSRLITNVAELKRLHDIVDENGQHCYGWDKLAEMSGMPSSTVRRKVKEYEASLANG